MSNTEVAYRGRTGNVTGQVFAIGKPVQGHHTVALVAGHDDTFNVYAAEKYNDRWLANRLLAVVTATDVTSAAREAASL